MLVLVLNVTGCGRLGGPAAAGPTDTSISLDDAASAPAGGTDVAPTPTAQATPRPGLNQPVAARRGPIAETLSLVGRVAASEDVPLAFPEKLTVKTVSVKPGQTVEAGQVLVTADATAIQSDLDQVRVRLDADTASLAQAQAQTAAQQRAAARQAAAAQQAQAEQVAAAEANLGTARANLQKVQAGPSLAELQAAVDAVTAAQIAARKADADQAKVAAGPDDAQIHAAEQELANAQAAVAKAQADLAKLPGGQVPDETSSTPAAPAPRLAENISPPGVSTDFNSPANNYGFQAIAVDPAHPGTVYVGTCYQGLWKTTDGGQSWAKVNTGTNGKALDSGRVWLVVLDPADSRVVYAAPGYGVGGLWKSADGGVNWAPLFPGNSPAAQQLGVVPTPTNLSIDPANHLHMIASSHFAWGDRYKSANGVGVLETNDGGNTWTVHDPIPNSGAEHEVAMIDSTTWLESFSGGIDRTTDAGATWTKVADNNAETQNLLATNGVLYLPSPSGLMRSTDKGASWQTVGPGSMTVVSDGTNLYTQASGPSGGHSEPLYYSPVNDGVNWSQYSSQSMCIGATCDGPSWAAYDAANHTLYFSNWNAGVWKLQTASGSPAPVSPPAAPVGKGGAGTSQSDVIAARQRLAAAKDAAEVARAKLQALRDGPDENTLDTAQLGASTAQSALAAAQARLDQLHGGPSPADLQAAQTAVKQAQASLDRARAGGAATQADDGAGDTSSDVIAARQSAIDNDNAQIAKLQDRLAGTQIVAPFTGTVVSIRAKVGDTLDENHAVLTIAKPGNPVVRLTVTQGDFDKVSVGQSALIQLPGQTDTAAPVTAQVSSLAPNEANTAKVAQLRVDWPDTAPKLGTVLNVGLVLQQKDDALLVPKKAVHATGSRTFVELVDGSSRRMANVQVGIIGSNDAEIVSGLSQGQLVAIGP